MTRAMKAYQVTMEERFSRGTDPGQDYRGRCYEMALMYLANHVDEPALRLVHGTLNQWRVPYGHAWIEIPRGRVFDPVTQVFYERETYYRVLQAEAERVYTPTEAEQLATKTKHCGPWHEAPL